MDPLGLWSSPITTQAVLAPLVTYHEALSTQLSLEAPRVPWMALTTATQGMRRQLATLRWTYWAKRRQMHGRSIAHLCHV
jgi:hypothetical protein